MPTPTGTRPAADRVYGQPNFTSTAANNGGVSATSLSFPFGVAADTADGLYVSDADNHRVLHHPAGSTTADRVYGQPNFTSNAPNTGGSSASSLGRAWGVAADVAGGLYVSDGDNNRMLHYPEGSTTADRVYGQPNFTSNTENAGGVSATSLALPVGIAVEPSGGLYIADDKNGRVLHYPAGSTTADRVYSQPNFTSNAFTGTRVDASSLFNPHGVALDAVGGLYVADYGNYRVVHYPSGSTTADRVYGQPSFTTRLVSDIDATSLYYPIGVAVDIFGGLYVADSGNTRVLHYPAGSTAADRVYGQPNFTSKVCNSGGVSAASLCNPPGVAVDTAGGLYVSDTSNNRVLHYAPGAQQLFP